MIKSNQAVTPLSLQRSKPRLIPSVQSDLNTLEDVHMRERVQRMERARATGSKDSLGSLHDATHLSIRPELSGVKPLVRKKTAREFSNE